MLEVLFFAFVQKKARWKIESCHDELLQEDNFDGDDQVIVIF